MISYMILYMILSIYYEIVHDIIGLAFLARPRNHDIIHGGVGGVSAAAEPGGTVRVRVQHP
jgi:hypothetical protein